MIVVYSGLFAGDEMLEIGQTIHEQAIMWRGQTVCGSADTATLITSSIGYHQSVSRLVVSYPYRDPFSGDKSAPEDVDNHTLSQLKAPISRSFALLLSEVLLNSHGIWPEL